MEDKLNKFLDDIKKINKDNLISIIRLDDNRILILLKEINFNNLLENSSLSRKIQKNKIIPLYLTEEYIKSSCDVYPIEYLNMKKNYKILFGKNILEELEIPAENIRLECEQKIKGALIRLTQVILEQGNNKKRLISAIFLALEDIQIGIEGILELFSVSESPSSSIFIDKAQDNLKVNLQPLKDVIDWKNGKKPHDYKKLIYDFYEKIEELAILIDKISISG